jgi:predicted Ser/Thr protein kinase
MKLVSEDKWRETLVDMAFDPDEMDLLSESNQDPYRRVYRDKKYCYKIVLKGEVSSILRNCTLLQECEILEKCRGIKSVPEPVKYFRTENAQVLVYLYLSGESLAKLKNEYYHASHILIELIKINYFLVAKGVSHNDLLDSNILVNRNGEVSIVDFDQAIVTGHIMAFIRTFLGINLGGPKIVKSMMGVILDVLMEKSPRIMKIFRNIKRAIFDRKKYRYTVHKLPVLKNDASDNAKLMLTAWEIAQISNASSPGILYAYYAIDFQGYKYPGERPWVDRWGELRDVTEYGGKRILELGCNMGLLTSYLMKYKSAEAALAVDRDKDILNAAKIINRALQVDVEHLAVDFDSMQRWEEKLIDFQPDIVFALNVLNWVSDKDRFLLFLGNFNKLVFEGHDDLEVECSRLRNIGFKKISVISISERDRELLYCEK